ncbi:hypothetical protein JB92DRAFT_2837738 [Gautieria morchelliformis]|nr:hypothetical protein JB92DRAFT_2837738 [Gautieria morchelliformis]
MTAIDAKHGINPGVIMKLLKHVQQEPNVFMNLDMQNYSVKIQKHGQLKWGDTRLPGRPDVYCVHRALWSADAKEINDLWKYQQSKETYLYKEKGKTEIKQSQFGKMSQLIHHPYSNGIVTDNWFLGGGANHANIVGYNYSGRWYFMPHEDLSIGFSWH